MAAVAGLATLAVAASVAALVATSQRQRAQTEASTTEQTMNFMVSLFTLADPTEARANELTVREMLDRGAADVKRQLRDRPAVRSSLMTAMGRAYTGLGLPAPAKDLLQEALGSREKEAGATSRATTETRQALAAASYLDGEYDAAEQQYRIALDAARQLGPGGNALAAGILVGLGDTLSQRGADAEAENAYREALRIDTQLYGPQSVETAQTMQGLAITLYYMERYDEAEQLTQQSLAIRRRALGERHWKVADSLNHLAAILYQTGRYGEAVKVWKECLSISEDWAGPDHPENGTVANNIGRGLLIDGRLDEATPYFLRHLDMIRRTKPPDHDDLILPLNSLAMIDLAQRRYKDAEIKLDEALAIAEKQNHWMRDQVLTNLADVYAKTGRALQAEALLTRARALLEVQYPLAEMPDEAWRYALQDAVRASAYASGGRYGEAEALLGKALPIIRARFGEQRYYTKDLEQRLAGVKRAGAKSKVVAND